MCVCDTSYSARIETHGSVRAAFSIPYLDFLFFYVTFTALLLTIPFFSLLPPGRSPQPCSFLSWQSLNLLPPFEHSTCQGPTPNQNQNQIRCQIRPPRIKTYRKRDN
ncbi:hypothetical protein EUGRSUZ_H02565 [Eucalyptus grandis]|uniref:Uncharacterized protein n=2 Tax=Eucalyptus grandis TaxID=71139 RepID=A0A059B2D3_EUCGR|nr:hypothetical protein EUGRSUZ_H02565 [Eucalyptus grandis]